MPRSAVDESLFGQPARKTMASALPSNSVVVSSADIAAIKQRSTLLSSADEKRERAAREADLEEKQKISRARKQKMIELEAEAKEKVINF
jgi:hypothetical protein